MAATTRRAQMDDWGADGPAIGPLRWGHTTYAFNVRIDFETLADGVLYFGKDFDDEVPTHDDMLVYEGSYYRDWTVYYVTPNE